MPMGAEGNAFREFVQPERASLDCVVARLDVTAYRPSAVEDDDAAAE
jgi:hypothetical protein